MLNIRKKEQWNPLLRRQVNALPPRLKMATAMEKVTEFVKISSAFLRHIAIGTEHVEPDLRLLEAAWRYAFNDYEEATDNNSCCSDLSTVEEYHEVIDIILVLTQYQAPHDIVSVDFEGLPDFPELVVLYHMLHARLKIDHGRLNPEQEAFLTVRDVQLLSTMRESSVRNAISAKKGRHLNSVQTDAGDRLIPVKDAEEWLGGCRWYKPTDLTQQKIKEFVEIVNAHFWVYDNHEG